MAATYLLLPTMGTLQGIRIAGSTASMKKTSLLSPRPGYHWDGSSVLLTDWWRNYKSEKGLGFTIHSKKSGFKIRRTRVLISVSFASELMTQNIPPCCGSPSAGCKRISRYRVLQKRMSLLWTKSRDNVGAVSTAGQPPDRPGRVDGSC